MSQCNTSTKDIPLNRVGVSESLELTEPGVLTETPYLSDFLKAISKLDKRDTERAYAAFDLWQEWLISLPTALTRAELQKRKRLEYFLNGALAKKPSND